MTTIPALLLAAIATRIPNVTLANALGLVEDFERYGYTLPVADLSSFEARVAYARSQPSVMQYVADTYEATKKIQAIKELRTLLAATPGGYAYSGLREVKDVIDHIVPKPTNFDF